MIPDSSHIALKRPHCHLRDNHLFFLISNRPLLALSPAGVDLWYRLNDTATVGALEQAVSGSRELLASWWQAGVIEFAECGFSSGRRKILVIEPHMDDAVLSVGGLMWQRRHTDKFSVLSLVGVSNFTSYQKIGRDYFDTAMVSDLRKRESQLVMCLLGGEHAVLSMHDAPLRYQPGDWKLDWFLRNRRSISASINSAPIESEIRSVAMELAEIFRTTDASEIWIPMGVGTSTDHETTRNGCLLALEMAGTRRDLPPVTLYQDVPYAMDFPWHSEQILSALRAAGAWPRPVHTDISDSMPNKLRLVSIFASQFKMGYMAPRVEETARLAAPKNAKHGELTVEIDTVPAGLNSFELYSGRDHVRDLAARLSPWRAKHRLTGRLSLLCPMGVGRWKETMTALLEHFPEAEIHIHLSADAFDETTRFVSPRIHIHPVPPNGKAWLRNIFGTLLKFPRPLIILTGWRFQRLSRWIRGFLLPIDALDAISPGHLVLALQLAAQHGSPPKHH